MNCSTTKSFKYDSLVQNHRHRKYTCEVIDATSLKADHIKLLAGFGQNFQWHSAVKFNSYCKSTLIQARTNGMSTCQRANTHTLTRISYA